MGYLGFLGFMLALIAYSEVYTLKKRVTALESARGDSPQ